MKYFIEERKTCYIEANSEEEALHKYCNGEGYDTDSDIDIEEVDLMELEEAKEILKGFLSWDNKKYPPKTECEAIETVLKALEEYENYLDTEIH